MTLVGPEFGADVVQVRHVHHIVVDAVAGVDVLQGQFGDHKHIIGGDEMVSGLQLTQQGHVHSAHATGSDGGILGPLQGGDLAF